MPLSRLRLRLGLGFSLVFAAGLFVFATGSLGYLWRESHRRLDERLDALANDVSINLLLELTGAQDRSASEVATEVVDEWPRNGGSFVIADEHLDVLAHNDSTARVREVLRGRPAGEHVHFDATLPGGERMRAYGLRYVAFPPEVPRAQTFEIVAFSSTAGISQDTELLLVAIGIAAPILLLLSLTGGYVMAARALRPVTDLSKAVASIDPDDLTQRLHVAEPQDELGRLAGEFNAMLARLNTAQTRNRRFVREAAHQIRTPLTLVLGEAALELATPDSPPDQMRGSLKRINLAAERMRRRVDELFLLAEAQTGERVLLTEVVDIDRVVSRAVELMRPRAAALGRVITTGAIDAESVKGNSELLHEGLLEMLENAIRHGDATRSVSVSAVTDDRHVAIEVASGGAAFQLPQRTENEGPDGLGLPIVQWVAEVHGGELKLVNHAGWNSLVISLPRH